MSVITVPFAELGTEYGLKEGDGSQGPFAVKPYLVAYSDRFQFSNDVLGKSRQSGGIGGTWLHTYPYTYPTSPNLWAREVTIDPVGEKGWPTPTGVIDYNYAVCTVSFGVPEFGPGNFDVASISQDPTEIANLQWATQELDWAAEWINVPNSSVKFASDDMKLNTPFGVRVTVVTMVLSWPQYPVMPMNRISGFADSLNDQVFLGCAKGTVMFEGAKTVREFNRHGTINQKVQMSFRWRAQDWNKSLRPDGITWDLVIDKSSTAGSPVTSFQYKDFRGLLLG